MTDDSIMAHKDRQTRLIEMKSRLHLLYQQQTPAAEREAFELRKEFIALSKLHYEIRAGGKKDG